MEQIFKKWYPHDNLDTMYDVDDIWMRPDGYTLILLPDGRYKEELEGQRLMLTWESIVSYYQFDPYMEIQLEADQVPAIKTFSQSIVKWLEEHGTEENRVIQQYGLSFPKIRRFADKLGHVCDVAMEHGYGLSGLGD